MKAIESTRTELIVHPAREDERPAALRMAFQHLTEREQTAKVRMAQDMIVRNDFDPSGIWVALDGTGLAGAMIVVPLPGATAIVWPPRVRISLENSHPVENALIIAGIDWLKSRNVRLAQTLLLPEESAAGASLLRNGFQRITRLIYMRHFLELSAEELAKPEQLTYRTVEETESSIVESVLARTHEGSFDCPELNIRRTPAEFLAGHSNARTFDAQIWWIAFNNQQPAALLLINASEPDTWDIAYLGVIPEMRRHGIGRELVRKALFEAKAAGMLTVTLALDERNEPAHRLYQIAGFEPYDERGVLLSDLGERRA